MLPFVVVSFGVLVLLPFSYSLQVQGKLVQPSLIPNSCNEICGKLHVPFPFYVNTSCVSISSLFHLTCSNSSTLLIKFGSESFPVLEFFHDGLLVDFPGSSLCRQYNDLNSFGNNFSGKDHFGVSVDNVIGLYDCEDSSLCKADCETVDLPGCDGSSGGSLGCCYPLSDHSIWHVGQGFSVFSQFGCRGFSSWAVLRASNSGKRGVKLEWAIPRNSSKEVCARNADMINATSIEDGVRCVCQDGYDGDGFTNGSGCLQSCIKNGQEAYGNDCYIKGHDQRKIVIIAGILGPVLIVASLVALFYLLKRPIKPEMLDTEQAYYHNVSIRKASRTRLFSHHELEEATNGFEESRKLMQGTNGTMFAGVLGDGSHVAIHKLKCENESDMIQVLAQIEVLSGVVHRNMACLIGCCIDSAYTPLVVYEYPANGTLEEHLHKSKGQRYGLDWYRRVSIATETACVVAFLHYENSPPIFHHNLKSNCIFLDGDFSVKIAGFCLLNSNVNHDSQLYKKRECFRLCKNDVYDMGVVLLEIISGSNELDSPTLALQKIKDGKLEEIVDPFLCYHEQPYHRQEQILTIAELSTRCMLFGADGKLGMIDVARELVHITKENLDGGVMRGPSLEETFSNSSLLQMISMSPDSMNVS
ncbi:hypothetical protein Lal_00025479 [Lupinus albus]|uniref:Uncharacterized protein n=1 Tax=Lupinus albus TaxID=3870 RepID=A0A6A5NYX6_LUPAL|nr:putative protein kinase RLK-Pelle-WAK-LRK10L-1 family [Lupinus albus]KAF1890146.1 hypothetical protein Lal_00025479 [Lupinus albus]